VIPMFTENCRDAFRTPRWGRRIFRPIYERTRMPLCPIYGGFPVKMITHLGKPIFFNSPRPSTPEQIKHLIKQEVHALIREHQRLPGSILKGMLQRVVKKPMRKQEETLLTDLREDHEEPNGNCLPDKDLDDEGALFAMSPAKQFDHEADVN